jgi:Concanavalin A-like lectin/glucanases superfamily
MRLFAVAVLLLLSFGFEAQGARGFGSTYGNGTTDKIQTGYAAVLPTQFSFSCWLWINGNGGGSLGRIYDSGGSADMFTRVASGNQISITEPFSTQLGQFTWNQPSLDAWHSLVVTWDTSSAANVPIIYIDGATQSVTTSVAPSGSHTGSASAYYFGNNAGANRNFDGEIAEVTFWTGILTAGEAAALAKGAEPLQIRPGSILISTPLWGNTSGERDLGPSHYSQTLTSTKSQPSPPVIMSGPEFRAR